MPCVASIQINVSETYFQRMAKRAFASLHSVNEAQHDRKSATAPWRCARIHRSFIYLAFAEWALINHDYYTCHVCHAAPITADDKITSKLTEWPSKPTNERIKNQWILTCLWFARRKSKLFQRHSSSRVCLLLSFSPKPQELIAICSSSTLLRFK